MIVRILGEGRYEVPDDQMGPIEERDGALVRALDEDDTTAFEGALDDLIAEVRRRGTLLDPADLRNSSLAVPHAGSTLAEVRELLAEEPDV